MPGAAEGVFRHPETGRWGPAAKAGRPGLARDAVGAGACAWELGLDGTEGRSHNGRGEVGNRGEGRSAVRAAGRWRGIKDERGPCGGEERGAGGCQVPG